MNKWIGLLAATLTTPTAGVWATAAPPPAIVASSTVRVHLEDEGGGPELNSIECAPKADEWFNSAKEELPSSVEVNGAREPVRWLRK